MAGILGGDSAKQPPGPAVDSLSPTELFQALIQFQRPPRSLCKLVADLRDDGAQPLDLLVKAAGPGCAFIEPVTHLMELRLQATSPGCASFHLFVQLTHL